MDAKTVISLTVGQIFDLCRADEDWETRRVVNNQSIQVSLGVSAGMLHLTETGGAK